MVLNTRDLVIEALISKNAFDKKNGILIFIIVPMVIVSICNLIIYSNKTCLGNITDKNYCELTYIKKNFKCINKNPKSINYTFRDIMLYVNFTLFILFLLLLGIVFMNNYNNPVLLKNPVNLLSFIGLMILYVFITFTSLLFINKCYSKPTECTVIPIKDGIDVIPQCVPITKERDYNLYLIANITSILVFVYIILY